MGPSLRRMCSRTCRYCSRRCSLRVQSAESLRRDAIPLLGSLRGEEKERGSSQRKSERASQPRPKEMPDTLREVRMLDCIYIYAFGRCYWMLTEGEANDLKKNIWYYVYVDVSWCLKMFWQINHNECIKQLHLFIWQQCCYSLQIY